MCSQNTGTVFQVHERLQGNLFISNESCLYSTVSACPNMLPTYVPMFWIDKNGVVCDDSANKFKNGVMLGHSVMHGVKIAGLVIGPLLIVASIVIAVVAMRRYVLTLTTL